ncbi:hypothetical protein K458DRAFT_118143 [Lentithecium fluviatile CBS 122367]|uniref:Uncharacterized protein n=1 Tax=Lentithecium fluviatile CBS 122367 TaxID=1168545 RepID=A0A6G1IN80_9PLEO|nr:hypothetical protein K458DRAFT_118143 [Lentithecium fluviatile CBS 122367]
MRVGGVYSCNKWVGWWCLLAAAVDTLFLSPLFLSFFLSFFRTTAHSSFNSRVLSVVSSIRSTSMRYKNKTVFRHSWM